MSTFKKDATGYIVVNLSKGPALNPTIHQGLSAARSKADRLAKGQPKDTFQVFEVIPDVNTYRYSEKVRYGYVFTCGGETVTSLAIYESEYAARKQASDLGHECQGTFEVRTQEAVGNLSPSEVRYKNEYMGGKNGMFLFEDKDEAVRVGTAQFEYIRTIEVTIP